MENCVSYPERVIQVGMNMLRLSWLDELFQRIIKDSAVKLKTAFSVVKKSMKAFALLKR
jgi:hypothetical protein